MGRYPTTLVVELKISQVTLGAFNMTLKLCTAAASKEFVNVLELQEKPPKGLDPEEQWLWVDRVKKSGWTNRTAIDAVVRYQTVKVQAWDAVAPTEFSINRRLRTHIPDITHPTLYSTDALWTGGIFPDLAGRSMHTHIHFCMCACERASQGASCGT